jgi:prolyl-tRNA editing enzyme YbaK/EbsC (Cys-tRNA(Pro) deacylase)
VFMDTRLLVHDVVWAAAGLPDAVFSVEPAALAAAAGAQPVDLAEER